MTSSMNTSYILVYCYDITQWNEYVNMLDMHYADSISYKLEIRDKSLIAHNTFTNEYCVYLRVTPIEAIYDQTYLKYVKGKCDSVWLCDKHLFIGEY